MMLESSLQSKYIKKLREAGWFVTKLMKTSTNGIPDTLCIRNGRVVFVEYKRPGYNTTPLQDYMIDRIKKEGIEVVVADSWTSLKHLVDE